jgi:WD40 repeat protein
VRCLAFDPDGKRAFSGGEDGTVRIWDTATMRQLHALTVGPALDGLAVVGEPGERVLCAVTLQGDLLRWDAQSLRSLGPARLPGTLKCFSPDGRYGLYAYGGNAWLIDTRTGKELKRFWVPRPLLGVYSGMAFTADGRRALVAVNRGQFALLETATGKELWRFHGAPDFITCLAVTPDGKHVLSGDPAGRVWMWEVASNRVVWRLFLGPSVWSVVLSADGRRALFLYGQGSQKQMQLWDLKEDRKLRSLDYEGSWGGALMSADGRRALTCDGYGRVRLWDLERGEELCPRADNLSEAYCVALSPNGRWVLTGHFNRVVLSEVRSGQIVKMLREKGGRVLAAAFSPDGNCFAYGDDHGKLHLRQTETTRLLWPSRQAHPSNYLRALVFSGDGKHLYSGGGRVPPGGKPSLEVGAIRVWDAATGQPAGGALRGHTQEVQSLALSHDGTQLLSGAGGADRRDCTVRLWDLVDHKESKRFEGHKAPVTSVAFAPDGKWFASASHGQMILWDPGATPGKGRRVLPTRGTRALAFVGERQVVTAENDRKLIVCGLEGEVISARLMPHLVNGLALSADGKHLATANSNGTVYILRLPLRRPH